MSAESVLKHIEDDLSRRLDAIGFVGENEIKIRTPVDSGYLRSKQTHTVERIPTGWRIVWGSNVRYQAPVELGHRTASGSLVAAQPHLVPGIVATKSSIKRILGGAK